MCVPQRLQLADHSSFSSGSRSISSANEICAINKRWEVHAPEWCVRRGWNHARRRGGIRSISSSCPFLQPVWEQHKQGVVLQESLVFSHLHTPEASCPFLLESTRPLQPSRSGFTVEAQQGRALGALCICECVGWSCAWGADNPEQCFGRSPVLLLGRRAQLSPPRVNGISYIYRASSLSFHWNSCELPAPLTNSRPQISYRSRFP